jgi:uncharacterized RDD family membrane protein YckC
MNVWIIIDGEKAGPIADYEIRKGIANGQYSADTVAWHEGCAEWQPLRSLALFEREFASAEPGATNVGEPSRVEVSPQQGEWAPGAFWVRRFWARWLDLHLYAGGFWLALYFLDVDVGVVLRNIWIMLLVYLPWVPLEAYLLARYGTTPGKWLAGIRIVNPTGGHLDFAVSLRRAVRVYFLGIGMGWGIVSMICQSLSLYTVRSSGSALWDRDGSHVLVGRAWKPMRGVALVVAYILVTQMQWIVIAPYFMEDLAKSYPEWYEFMEKSPPRHLPRKH